MVKIKKKHSILLYLITYTSTRSVVASGADVLLSTDPTLDSLLK